MTRKNINPKTNQPYKALWFGDLVTPSGFGRIGNEVTRRLQQRGWTVQGASISYTGWPHDLPYWVWPLGGQDMWGGLVGIVNQWQPDIIISCQDFPYHQTIWHGCKIDFSRVKWVWITPIDGTPVHPEWAKLADVADGCMVISQFGVEALRQAGKRVGLCRPGVDSTEFYPATAEERKELRAKAGWGDGPDPYVVGVVCMNQGRKAIAPMVAAFHEFARDKPEARLFLDIDKISPAGWDLPNLLKQMGWSETEQQRVIYREDLFKADMASFAPLRNRYALMDAHMVISHREGYGLPLAESMACGVPTLALDWCSGTEIVGGGRGMLVKRIPYMEHGTWGGALDAFPDMDDLVSKLNWLYANPAGAAAVAETGRAWAAEQTWDKATDSVEDTITAALRRERKEKPNGSDDAARSGGPISPGYKDVYGPGFGGRPDAAGAGAGAEPVSGHPVLQPLPSAGAAAQEPGADAGGDGHGDAGPGPASERGDPGPG